MENFGGAAFSSNERDDGPDDSASGVNGEVRYSVNVLQKFSGAANSDM